jgi:hypothetical protein
MAAPCPVFSNDEGEMKMPFRKFPILAALAGGSLGYGIALAQLNAMDPVQAAPHIYRKVFENEYVRVLKVTDRNGQTAPVHSHPDRVGVFLSPCAWMEHGADGSDRMQSYRLGDVVWWEAETHGGETSNVVQECSLLEIELKQLQSQ